MKRRNALLALCAAMTGCGGGGGGGSDQQGVVGTAAEEPATQPPPPQATTPPTDPAMDDAAFASFLSSFPGTTSHDDFHRSDRPLRGDTLPTGETWKVTGFGYLTAAIKGGIYVAEQNSYSYISAPGPLGRVAGVFSFVPGLGANDPRQMGMTLIADKRDTNGGLQDMLHLNFGPTGWNLTKRLAGGSFVGIGFGNYTLRTDGTRYGVAMTIKGDTVTVRLPDGSERVIQDADIPAIGAQFAAYQITANPNGYVGRWHGVARGI